MDLTKEVVTEVTAPHPGDHALLLKDNEVEEVSGNVSADLEREASRQGWVPKEQFRGPDDEWIDAQTFIQRGKEINPILRANNSRLKQQLDSLSAQNNVLVQELLDLKKGQQTIQQRDYDTTIKLLKDARFEAMESGDNQRFLALDEQIDNIRNQHDQLVPQVLAPQQPTQEDPEFSGWLQANQWYGSDEWRTVTINKIAEEMRRDFPHLVGRRFLDEVLDEATTRYPGDFGGNHRTRDRVDHQMVEGGGRRQVIQQGGRKKTVSDLPVDARDAMQKFVRDGLMTEQRYLDLFFAGA